MRPALLALALVALAGCGGHGTRSAEDVARSWSAALDRNDNEAAGWLFADGAKVVQNGELVLSSHADAVRWNASLPCGGHIVSVTSQGATDVLVVFRLEERPQHRCDGPGGRGRRDLPRRNGKIVLWHQTAVPPPGGGGTPV